jgi:hypothetical protein
VVTNIHVDDDCQVQRKVWESASVCDIQIAGGQAGVKGKEFNNIIVVLSDYIELQLDFSMDLYPFFPPL